MKYLLIIFCCFCGMNFTYANPAKDIMGTVTVSAIHGSDAESNALGKPLAEELAKRLQKDPHLKFSNYQVVGSDSKPLFRSIENWARPLGNDDLLLRFEPQALPSRDNTRLDLELWISRNKILKTGTPVTQQSPLFILGPDWKGGKLILIITLVPNKTPIYDTSTP